MYVPVRTESRTPFSQWMVRHGQRSTSPSFSPSSWSSNTANKSSSSALLKLSTMGSPGLTGPTSDFFHQNYGNFRGLRERLRTILEPGPFLPREDVSCRHHRRHSCRRQLQSPIARLSHSFVANSISCKCGHRCVCSNPSFSTICLWEPGDQVCFLYILHIRMCSFKFDGQKSDFNIGLQFYSGYIGQLRRLRSYCRATLYFTLYFVHALPLMSVQSIASWILTLCFD